MKMSTTNLFNILQGLSESMRDYLSCFNKSTIKVVPPYQEMFMGEFQNQLKMGHFNESLAQRSTLTLAEVVSMVECYIKDEERNAEKKARGIKEHVLGA